MTGNIGQIAKYLESIAPLNYQEDYDNCGLQVGDPEAQVTGVLICLDVTEAIIEEAISQKCNLIVSHHPLIFRGIKSLTGKNWVERTILKAIQANIAVYAIHTNLDNIWQGVNRKICDRLGLEDVRVLATKKGLLKKLVTFCPKGQGDNGGGTPDKVRQALFNAGAGRIGDYDHCSYNLFGTGTFRPLEGTNPYVGQHGQEHHEQEERIEMIFPAHLQAHVVSALQEAHPYEEVAYDIYALDNAFDRVGSGMIGRLPEPMDANGFLNHVKLSMQTELVRHTQFPGGTVKTVAVCGGSGSFLLQEAIRQQADAFVTGDFKYHQFFDAERKLIICDIGHYESEQFTIELIYELLREKFANFALRKTELNTNPINYFYFKWSHYLLKRS